MECKFYSLNLSPLIMNNLVSQWGFHKSIHVKLFLNRMIMKTFESIKPGPKPKKENGTPDKRRRVTPESQPKHPGLKPHHHTPGDSK